MGWRKIVKDCERCKGETGENYTTMTITYYNVVRTCTWCGLHAGLSFSYVPGVAFDQDGAHFKDRKVAAGVPTRSRGPPNSRFNSLHISTMPN